MATNTYTPIASITLGSSASSVEFSSIPQDYRDLVLVVDGTLSQNGNIAMYFNGDTGANYTRVEAGGTGSSVFTSAVTTPNQLTMSSTQTSSNITQIMDYSATDKHKTRLTRNNYTAVIMNASRWANTAAVTQILLDTAGRPFTTGTTLALYGIEA